VTTVETLEDGTFLADITDLVQRSALEYAQSIAPVRRAIRVAIEHGLLEHEASSALATVESLDNLAMHFHELVQMGKVKLPEAP